MKIVFRVLRGHSPNDHMAGELIALAEHEMAGRPATQHAANAALARARKAMHARDTRCGYRYHELPVVVAEIE